MGTQFRSPLSANDKKRIQILLDMLVNESATDAEQSDRWKELRPRVREIVDSRTPERPEPAVDQPALDRMCNDPVLEQVVISGVIDMAFHHYQIIRLPESPSLCRVLRFLGDLYQRASDLKDAYDASDDELVDELDERTRPGEEEPLEPDPFETVVRAAWDYVLSELKKRGAATLGEYLSKELGLQGLLRCYVKGLVSQLMLGMIDNAGALDFERLCLDVAGSIAEDVAIEKVTEPIKDENCKAFAKIVLEELIKVRDEPLPAPAPDTDARRDAR